MLQEAYPIRPARITFVRAFHGFKKWHSPINILKSNRVSKRIDQIMPQVGSDEGHVRRIQQPRRSLVLAPIMYVCRRTKDKRQYTFEIAYPAYIS